MNIKRRSFLGALVVGAAVAFPAAKLRVFGEAPTEYSRINDLLRSCGFAPTSGEPVEWVAANCIMPMDNWPDQITIRFT